jgi:hypothetical protein
VTISSFSIRSNHLGKEVDNARQVKQEDAAPPEAMKTETIWHLNWLGEESNLKAA